METNWGTVAGKLATLIDGTVSFSPEYESCRRIAGERNVALQDVYEAALRAFDATAAK